MSDAQTKEPLKHEGLQLYSYKEKKTSYLLASKQDKCGKGIAHLPHRMEWFFFF
jgi:hypothetical protein